MPNPNPSLTTRFKPGNPGGPGGSRRKKIISVEIEALMEASDGKAAKELAQVILREALNGDIAFIREILDRVEGKPVAAMEVKTTTDTTKSDAAAKAENIVTEMSRRNDGDGG